MRERLGIEVTSIAFPFGLNYARVREALARGRLSGGPDRWRGLVSAGDDLMSLPRVGISVTLRRRPRLHGFSGCKFEGNFGYARLVRHSRQRLVEAAALLVFLTRSAGAWIVTSDLACGR